MTLTPSVGIIIPNDFVKRLPFGGGSGFIQNLISVADCRMTIFGAGANGTPLWQPQRLNQNTTFVATYGLNFPSRNPLRLTALGGYLRNRRRILARDVDLLYVHSPECALPFLFGPGRKPVVFHQHGSGNPVTTAKFRWARNAVLARFFDTLHRTIYRRADWIIAIDRLCRQQAETQGAGARTSLLMNAVDTTQFRPDPAGRAAQRRRRQLAPNEICLLFVGRLEDVKQLDRLIVALTELTGEPHVHLFIAGDGTQRRALTRQVRELNLQPRVTFLGKVPHNRLATYYNMADILLLPSKMEGVPMVILEALACGTPVIASAVGGIPDLITHGDNGLLLDHVSPQTIAAGVRRLATLKPAPDRVAASVSQWRADTVAAHLTTLFNQLLERR